MRRPLSRIVVASLIALAALGGAGEASATGSGGQSSGLTGSALQEVARITERVGGQTSDQTFDNEPDLRDALSAAVPAGGPGGYAHEHDAPAAAPARGLSLAAVPDVQRVTERPVNAGFAAMLTQGGFGAIGGAILGFGLLPLLGVFGVVVGSILGAAALIAAKGTAAAKKDD